MFAEEEAALLVGSHRTGADLEALVARRVAGEPLETVLGWVAFRGRRIPAAPGLFVPRRRTELLARRALAALPRGGVAVELCCGVGPVARVLAEDGRDAEVHAADLDPRAVAAAREHLRGLASVHLGDLFAALPEHLRGRVDVLAANAPYVPTAAIASMPPEARDHESLLALDGGRDGVEVHRRIAAGVAGWLSGRGVAIVETSLAQAASTAAALVGAGLAAQIVADEECAACVVEARLTPAVPG